MTVEQLIEALEGLPPNKTVAVCGSNCGVSEIVRVDSADDDFVFIDIDAEIA